MEAKALAGLVDLFDAVETPFTSLLPKGRGWTVPDFCAKTKKQEVQPFMDYYQELNDALEAVRPQYDDDEEDWGTWQPSETWIKLSRLANRIGQLAYQEVDNPAYDADACLEWKENNPGFAQNKIEWGMSDLANTGTHPLPSSESPDMGG